MMQELEHTKILHDSQSFKDRVGQLHVELKGARDQIAELTRYKEHQESMR